MPNITTIDDTPVIVPNEALPKQSARIADMSGPRTPHASPCRMANAVTIQNAVAEASRRA